MFRMIMTLMQHADREMRVCRRAGSSRAVSVTGEFGEQDGDGGNGQGGDGSAKRDVGEVTK